MPVSSNFRVTGSITITFANEDEVERLRDCLQDGYNASPRNQLFADDILEIIDELNAILERVG